MRTPPIPSNDADRLRALHRLLILDTPPEERFDRIVDFAAQEFDTSMAQLSLVDEHRQWLKARVGLSICETSRGESFCGHLVNSPDGLIVEDTLLDERFFDNPLVIDGPRIRFYAGSPLILPCGNIVGALCILDCLPRSLDATDRAILDTLRDLAVNELLGGCAHAG